MKLTQLQASYNKLTAYLQEVGGGQNRMAFSVFEVLTDIRNFADVIRETPRLLNADEAASLWVMSDMLGRKQNWARQALLACGKLQWANRFYPFRKQGNRGTYNLLVGVAGVGGGSFTAERPRRVSRLNTMSLALIACGGHTANSRRYLLTESEKI